MSSIFNASTCVKANSFQLSFILLVFYIDHAAVCKKFNVFYGTNCTIFGSIIRRGFEYIQRIIHQSPLNTTNSICFVLQA